MQRRVDQPDRHRQPVHRLEDAHEVVALHRQQRRQRGVLLLGRLGHDQVLHQLAAVTEEHVLGPAQPDALGAEAAGPGDVLGGVGVGAYGEPPLAVRVVHDPRDGGDQLVVLRRLVTLEVPHHQRVPDRHVAVEHLAGRAVDGDDVALGHDQAVRRGHPAGLDVHVERVRAAHAGATHAACHHRGVRGLATAAGQDAAGRHHPVQVVGVGLPADQDHGLTALGPLDRDVRVEHDPADRGTRRRVHARGDQLPLGAVVEPREHQLRELGAGDPLHGLVHRDEALVDELAGDPEGRLGGPLPHPRLEHPELAVLDGELDVAQVAVVVLERRHDRHELVVRLLVQLLQVGERDGVADARDDVLALRVLQVVAVHALRPRGGVTGERDAGAGVLAHVAEDHRADVDRGAEVAGDPLLAAVEHGPLGVPRLEDRPHREVELLARVLRELAAGVLEDQRLVRRHQAGQVLGGEVDVVAGAPLVLERVQLLVECRRLDAQHRRAEHLEQAPVGVEREPLVTAHRGREAVHALVVEPDVEDGVHHPGHGELRPGAHRHQQRIRGITQTLAHRLLERVEVRGDLVVQPVGLAALLEVGPARVGADREPRRHREPESGHLGEVRALAPEQVLLVLAALEKS